MAVGTTVSRLTGLLRLLALVFAVKAFVLADAYNLANTMPNIVVDLVLGGVVSATFVPVFVERLTGQPDDAAWDAISAVTSVTLVLLGVASLLFLVASPLIIDLMTALYHGTQSGAERQVATDLLILFVPQLTGYGVIALSTALLNARGRFGAPMFAPIANNLVLVAVYVTFAVVVRSTSISGVEDHRGRLLLLGLGTTLGVVAQAAVLVPSLRRADLRLRWLPSFRHEAVRRIVRLSGWTFGLVVGNQVALLVVLALSQRVGTGAVSAYTYAYAFFQLPYGIVAVSIMTATVPELARHWTTGDLGAFRRRLAVGLRGILAIVVPAAAGMVVLARPLLLLLGVVIGHASDTGETGQSLTMLALGLPGFCVFIYGVRVLQSIQDLRSAFWVYAVENAVNIVFAVALAGPLGVRGIALSISLAYTVGAAVSLAVVRRRVAGLAGDVVTRPLGRVLLASAALVVAAAAGVSISASQSLGALALRVTTGVVAGLVAFVVAAGILGWIADRRRPRHPREHPEAGRGAQRPGSAPHPPSASSTGRSRGRTAVLPGAGADPDRDDTDPDDTDPDHTERNADGAAASPLPPGRTPGRLSRPEAGDDSSDELRGVVPVRRSRRGRRRNGGTEGPPRPLPPPPAGRPPIRPGRLGPTRKPGSGGARHGRLDG